VPIPFFSSSILIIAYGIFLISVIELGKIIIKAFINISYGCYNKKGLDKKVILDEC
jgi:hypothetical protein